MTKIRAWWELFEKQLETINRMTDEAQLDELRGAMVHMEARLNELQPEVEYFLELLNKRYEIQ